MPYLKPTNRKFCLNSDIADLLLMRQEDFPCEPFDETYYKKVDKKYQTKKEILENFWLGCGSEPGCGDTMRDPTAPYEAWLGIDKYYLENVFKYPVNPNDLPYDEPQFAYVDQQWVQYKDIFGVNYHFTINGLLSDSWTTHYYAQTNKNALPTSDLNKDFTVTSFKERKRATYTDDYETAKANAPEGCEHYTVENDKVQLIYHHGIPPLVLMYKSATSWRQDSFTTSEEPFHAVADPSSYVIPTTDESVVYDSDITFTLPEYSGLTEVNYVWNIRQIESGLTLKAIITQIKKTGTVSFENNNVIVLEAIGSEGPRGVTPQKGVIYTGDYKDGVNDTISWYNRTNGITPETGNFTDEDHVNSQGLDDTVTMTSSESWVHDIVYDINHWEGFADWWRCPVPNTCTAAQEPGEIASGPRETTISIGKKDPRLDIVDPSTFIIREEKPIVKYCYHFGPVSVSPTSLNCSGGTVNVTVTDSYRDVYHNYSQCDDGTDYYYVRREQLSWSLSVNDSSSSRVGGGTLSFSVGMNTGCTSVTYTPVVTQEISNQSLTGSTVTQSWDCDQADYINNCSASPSSVGYAGGSVSLSANARYYLKRCTVLYDDTTFSPRTYTIEPNTSYSSRRVPITLYNAGSASCTVYVNQEGRPAPAGCSPNNGYELSASVSPSSVDCSGGQVTISVSAFKLNEDGTRGDAVAWTASPGGSGSGSGTVPLTIVSTDSDKTTTISITSEAGSCDLSVSQTGCGGGGGDTGGTGETCDKCVFAFNTPERIGTTPSGGGALINCAAAISPGGENPYGDPDGGGKGNIIFYVYQACDADGNPVGWDARIGSRANSWDSASCSYATIEILDNPTGYCCPGYDNCGTNSPSKIEQCSKSCKQRIRVHLDDNTTDSRRSAYLMIKPNNSSCLPSNAAYYQQEICQYNAGQEEPVEYWYMFADDSSVSVPAEGITVTTGSSSALTLNLHVSPSTATGCTTANCNITRFENTHDSFITNTPNGISSSTTRKMGYSASQNVGSTTRTATVTVFPNDQEHGKCSANALANGLVTLEGPKLVYEEDLGKGVIYDIYGDVVSDYTE